jgi:hypothetical protein
MSETCEEKNKALVLDAFDALFNRRDYVAAERFSGHPTISSTALTSRPDAKAVLAETSEIRIAAR